MSVISTYLNDNAQTPLNRFVVYMLYNQACNRHGDKSIRWSLSLKALACDMRGLKHRTCDIQQSVERDIVDSSLPSGEENMFLTPQLCIQKNGSREQTKPLLGVICHPFAKT